MSVLKRDLDLEGRPYRSISEVADLLGIKPHVLRYWESQFSALRPRKNRAGNRMYRPEEIRTLMHIKELLYARRFTIEGAKKKLLEERREEPQVEIGLASAPAARQAAPAVEPTTRILLHDIKTELRALLGRLR